MTLHTEILEQPDVLARLMELEAQNVKHIAAALRERGVQYAFLAARGTSDHAGLYAKYLWGAHNRLPLAEAAPSLFTLYRQPPALDGALAVGISQSGQSPDIISVLEEARRQGRPALAITNNPASPLAQAADFVLDVHAGEEKAVAATKSYTAELMAVALLSGALDGDSARWRELKRVPAWVRQVLKLDQAIAGMVQRYRYMQRCVVLGRGYNYATAYEWALKLKELTYVLAEPYSSADFQHGPVAIVEHGFPVLAVIPGGEVYPGMLELLHRLHSELAADLVVVSDSQEALALAQSPIPLPSGIPEWLTPLVAIVAGQLFAYHLTIARGYDTETPRSIHKVTETR